MRNVIDTKIANEHKIEPYRFKVLGGGTSFVYEEESITPDIIKSEKAEENIVEKPNAEPIVKQDEQQNKFIEELLKKSDELSSNIIKLQMQVEKQEIEFQNRLTNELDRESKSSYEKGYQEAKKELASNLDEIKQKFYNSISILENEAKKGNDFLKKIENELSQTAVEVAKEVIFKEIKHSSSEIAMALSKNLMEELKDAKNIKLKVNPKDYDALKEVYSSIDNIRIDADSAIAEGGVVVLSDVGNLDGNISTRLEKVKNLIENG